jgi:hypothetical protein
MIQIQIQELDGAQKGLKINVLIMAVKTDVCVGLVDMNPMQLEWAQTTSYAPDITFCSKSQTGKKSTVKSQKVNADIIMLMWQRYN